MDQVGRLYGYLLTASIVTRWMLFIIPILALFWIPGILALTTYPNASVSYFMLLISLLSDEDLSGVGRRFAVVEYLAQCTLGRYDFHVFASILLGPISSYYRLVGGTRCLVRAFTQNIR
jgi:hypothetical protein